MSVNIKSMENKVVIIGSSIVGMTITSGYKLADLIINQSRIV